MRDEYQVEVYVRASALAAPRGSVLDIGCGSAFKLLRYFKGCRITGVEVGETLESLKKIRGHVWLGEVPSSGNYDLVIMSDVIEHLVDPVCMMGKVARLTWKHAVISTVARKPGSLGPPSNECHAQEWSREEFARFVGSFFVVCEHSAYRDLNGSEGQILVCKKEES